MFPSAPGVCELSAADLQRIDTICEAFERTWQEGRPEPIEAHRTGVESALWPRLTEELIRLELEWRCRRGQKTDPADYRRRFPEHAEALESWQTEAQAAAGMIRAGGEPPPAGSTVDLPAAPSTDGAAPEPVAPKQPDFPRTLGEYESLDRLASGGMGTVYRARHRRLGKLVAVKLIAAQQQGARLALKRFEREVRAVGQLDYPHLVEAHDAGDQDGTVYLVLKLIEGSDLDYLVKQRGPLPAAEACELVRQAALGLQYLHERDLVHRDIKPANLMRTPEGQVKVLDLGLARLQTPTADDPELTTEGHIVGTPDYMAPEQATDRATADIRADLYSLGATLFYLLTGQPPFAECRTRESKIAAHLHTPPPDVGALQPNVPERVRAVTARLLAKQPASRYATPLDLADELARVLQEPGSPSTGDEHPPARLARRRRLRLVAGAVFLAVLAAGVLLFAFAHRGEPVARDLPDHGNVVQPDPAEGAIRLSVRRLDVQHFRPEGKGDRPLGILGVRSFTARVNDAVTIHGELSEPAYCYLIAYRPDGTEELCLPKDEITPPSPTFRPRYPFREQGMTYGLNEGHGLMAFVLVASRRALPAYDEWKELHGPSPWKSAETPPGVVWRYDGHELLAFTEDDSTGTRGKGRELRGTGALGPLLAWFQQAPDVETVAAIAFPVILAP
jgi:hypothetical protein